MPTSLLVIGAISTVTAVGGFIVGMAAGLNYSGKSRVAETPDGDPRDGWSPKDGSGYIPSEERDRPEIETMTAFHGDFND